MARFKAFASESEDDGGDSDSSLTQPTRKSSPPKATKPISRPTSYASSSSSSSSLSPESIEDEEEYEKDSIMDEDELRPASEHEDVDQDEPAPWPRQLDLEPHRVHVMQTSLFRMPELAKAQKRENPGFLKHHRSQDLPAEPKEAPPRTSFAQPRTTQPPARKYVRVSSSASIAANHEGVMLDAGLSFGRSFRAGWAAGNRLVRIGELNASASSSKGANSSVVNVTTMKVPPVESPDLLQHLLSHTPIHPPSFESDDTPYVEANRHVTFSSFLPLFAPQDKSHSALVFRLAHALFDPLRPHLAPDVKPSIRKTVEELRRADALSTWLSHAVSPSVDHDLRTHASSDSSKIAFLHLTGNQVEKAVEALTNGNNIRLATLISQVPGDIDFRVDMGEQLQIWRDEKVDAHMSKDVRKLYALAAGQVDFMEGSSRREDIDLVADLDWLRVFGLQLWYFSLLDTPLRESFETYEQLAKEAPGRVAPPLPWYSKSRSLVPSAITDGLFNLIKLFCSSSMTLESTLNPLSFSPNPRDYKIPWLLYIILSRCLRLRDFTDRQLQDAVIDEDSDVSQEIEGLSQTANALTLHFATQLQQEGLIQEAAFVLLFLEDDVGRKRAIKELLARSAPHLNEWNIAGLHGSLKIPREWIDEARATYAIYNGDIYTAYELYTEAKAYSSAHELAITYLAPEAILCDDLDLLSSLFTALDENAIESFGVGGQLFIDYVNIVSRVPELRERRQLEDAIPDAAETLELETLTGRIPKLIGILPDVLRDKQGSRERCRAALSHMLSKLLDCLDPSHSVKVDIQSCLVDEAALLRHIHSTAYGSFLKTITNMA